jgi:hypothetical protein
VIPIGSFPRLYFALISDFPLNDGGLFYSMIRDIQANNLRLPTYASYNAAQIPFAYPPLSFYLAAGLEKAFGWPLLDIIRVFPALVSVITIPVFFQLSRFILKRLNQAVLATFAFATLPTAFDWLVMGGGLARAPGFVFALLALVQALLFFTHEEIKYLLGIILFASLTLLTHPGMAWFAAYSGVVLFLFYGRKFKNVVIGMVVIIGVLLFTSPWWLDVVSRHGLSPFINASRTNLYSWSTLFFPLLFVFTNEPLLDILAVLGFFGILVCLRDRKFNLPLWLVVIIGLQTRGSTTYAIVPFAMLIGVGLDEVILPLLTRSEGENHLRSNSRTRESAEVSFPYHGWVPKTALGYILVVSMISAYLGAPKESLSQAQLESLSWIGENTEKDGSFAIITGKMDSGTDALVEWFPALTGRVSIVTPQGYEWLPGGAFKQLRQSYAGLQACVATNKKCLQGWNKDAFRDVDYVYLAFGTMAADEWNRELDLFTTGDLPEKCD